MNSGVSISPADELEGVTLASGWTVKSRVAKRPSDTGGSFGTCYLATKDGETAFVKAIDFRRAFHEEQFLSVLNVLTSHVLWEKELLEFCADHSMSRIVRLLDYEDFIHERDGSDQTKKVCCLVFEVGKGDLRRHFDIRVAPDKSWRLRVVRDIALALDQLHRRGIAHLDVKPSNVILVGDLGKRAEAMKLGDLGRSVRKGRAGPFDALTWPGDKNYMPPEKWYGYKSAQWNDEREAADVYLLGSLAVYLLTGVPMNTLLFNEVPEAFKPWNYRGDFDEQLVDVLTQAQAKALAIFVVDELPPEFKDELLAIISELTDPDPSKRGDRKARRQGTVGIDRYHQKLLRISDRLALLERRAVT